MPARAYDTPTDIRVPEPPAHLTLPTQLRAAIVDAARCQAQWDALPERTRARGTQANDRRAFNDTLAAQRAALRVDIERAQFGVANAAGASAVALREQCGDVLPPEFEALVRHRATLMRMTIETAPIPTRAKDRRAVRVRADNIVIGARSNPHAHVKARTAMRENTRALCAVLATTFHTLTTITTLSEAMHGVID